MVVRRAPSGNADVLVDVCVARLSLHFNLGQIIAVMLLIPCQTHASNCCCTSQGDEASASKFDGAGASTSGAGPSVALSEEDQMLLAEDDDELDPDELDALEESLAATSLKE